MNAMIFGMMVALAVSAHINSAMKAAAAMANGESYDSSAHLIVATICTGIAAGMVYGGGV